MEAEWPFQEQTTTNVEETLVPVELVAIRLTVVKEFSDPAVWKSARRNGQRVLDPEQTGREDIRLARSRDLEERLTGYVKMAKGAEQAVLNPDNFSAKALITAERLKSDTAFL